MNIEQEIKYINKLMSPKAIDICNSILLENNKNLNILSLKIYVELFLHDYDKALNTMSDFIIEISNNPPEQESFETLNSFIRQISTNINNDVIKNYNSHQLIEYLNTEEFVLSYTNYMEPDGLLEKIILNDTLSKSLNLNIVLTFIWYRFLFYPLEIKNCEILIGLYPELEKIIYLSFAMYFENGWISPEELLMAYDKLIKTDKTGKLEATKAIHCYNAGLLSDSETILISKNVLKKGLNNECLYKFIERLKK